MKKSIGSGRGSVYNIILKTLQSGDKYGYEICKEVEEKTDGVYILKQPSLYSGLKRLEAQGEISSYWRDSALGGRRHYYSLTEKGRDRIEQSNFNWQDARDEIIGSLFEKSELDKTIESAQKDVEDIKTISEKNSSYEKDIDEILESTKDLFDFGNKEADSHTNENSFETKDADAKNSDNSENVEETIDSPKTEQESENAETSNDFGDLFSMFKTVEQADEVKQNVLYTKTSDDLIDDEQVDSNNITKQEEIVETKNEEKPEIKEAERTEQLDLFSFITSDEHESNTENLVENSTTSADNTNEEQLVDNTNQNANNSYGAGSTFEEIENNLKTVDGNNEIETVEENVEENDAEITDEIKKHETQSNQKTDKTITLQKNNSNWFEEYKNESGNSISFSDNTIFEKPENTFSNFEPYSSDFSLDRDWNFNNSVIENENNASGLNNDEAQIQVENAHVEGNDESKTGQTLDYNNIFGDLISKENNSKNTEESSSGDSEIYANEYKRILGQMDNDADSNDFAAAPLLEENNSKIEKDAEENQATYVDDLPRDYNALNDINLTLIKVPKDNDVADENLQEQSREETNHSDFEPYDTSAFKTNGNPFEQDVEANQQPQVMQSYSNNVKNIQNNDHLQRNDAFKNSTNHANNYNGNDTYEQKTKDMSFDKKYANSQNNFEVPDYEIRYYKKHTVDNSASRFLSINKLNLANSFVVAFIICLFTTLTLTISTIKTEFSGFQAFLYILSYVFAAGILLLNFLKYISNRTKKIQQIKKIEMSYRLFISILIVILTLAINLFMGMNFNNIANYSASFILPVFYSILILINYPFRRFLSKFTTFYN